ncbi:hypothetical protein AB0F43_15900 [Kribbella sp. NPDC023972]|uniref:hypothetical protein n=1 Tax=Kribbella sp. NPDC023972 TaxID=3154795 RepID=UPI0033FB8CF7
MSEAKPTRGGGIEWTDDEVRELREPAEGHAPIGLISVRLRRSEGAVRVKAEAEGMSLAPAKRAQYGDMS